jgi:hypothetical protein
MSPSDEALCTLAGSSKDLPRDEVLALAVIAFRRKKQYESAIKKAESEMTDTMTTLHHTVMQAAKVADKAYAEGDSRDIVKVVALGRVQFWEMHIAALRVSKDTPAGTEWFDKMVKDFENDIRYGMSDFFGDTDVHIAVVNETQCKTLSSVRVKKSDFDMPVNPEQETKQIMSDDKELPTKLEGMVSITVTMSADGTYADVMATGVAIQNMGDNLWRFMDTASMPPRPIAYQRFGDLAGCTYDTVNAAINAYARQKLITGAVKILTPTEDGKAFTAEFFIL